MARKKGELTPGEGAIRQLTQSQREQYGSQIFGVYVYVYFNLFLNTIK